MNEENGIKCVIGSGSIAEEKQQPSAGNCFGCVLGCCFPNKWRREIRAASSLTKDGRGSTLEVVSSSCSSDRRQYFYKRNPIYVGRSAGEQYRGGFLFRHSALHAFKYSETSHLSPPYRGGGERLPVADPYPSAERARGRGRRLYSSAARKGGTSGSARRSRIEASIRRRQLAWNGERYGNSINFYKRYNLCMYPERYYECILKNLNNEAL